MRGTSLSYVRQLEAENRDLRRKVQLLMATVDVKQDRIEELESSNQGLREEADQLRRWLDMASRKEGKHDG